MLYVRWGCRGDFTLITLESERGKIPCNNFRGQGPWAVCLPWHRLQPELITAHFFTLISPHYSFVLPRTQWAGGEWRVRKTLCLLAIIRKALNSSVHLIPPPQRVGIFFRHERLPNMLSPNTCVYLFKENNIASNQKERDERFIPPSDHSSAFSWRQQGIRNCHCQILLNVGLICFPSGRPQSKYKTGIASRNLTLSLPRVVNFKLPLQPHQKYRSHHTAWRTLLSIAYSDERWWWWYHHQWWWWWWWYYQFSLPHLYISLQEVGRMYLFDLGSERINTISFRFLAR